MHDAQQKKLNKKDYIMSDSISMNFLEKRPLSVQDGGTAGFRENWFLGFKTGVSGALWWLTLGDIKSGNPGKLLFSFVLETACQ